MPPQYVMTLRLLGGMHVQVDDETITSARTERLQSLFAFLALHRDHPLRRDYIAFSLWPDQPEMHARQRLRKALHDLRNAMPLFDLFVAVESNLIRWTNNHVVVDVEDFERTVKAAYDYERAGNVTMAIARLEEAIELYAGDLMPDNYYDWFAMRRRQLQGQFVDALQSIGLLLERQQDFGSAISFTKKLLQHEPAIFSARSDDFYESIFRRLVRLSGHHLGRADVEWAFCMYVYARSQYGLPQSDQMVAEYESALQHATDAATIVKKIPVRLTPFLGRQHDMAAVTERILDRQCKLLTLIGPAGVGKTSLAQQVVRALNTFVHGIYFVPARTVNDEAQLLRLIAETLDLGPSQEVELSELLLHFAEGKRLLLILDNYEHLVDSSQWLVALIEQAHGVKVLVTSRVRLNLAAEWVYELRGLGWRAPITVDEQANLEDESGAVELFRMTAQRVDPGFSPSREEMTDIVRICELAEGLPLAIELAAAWVRLFSCRQIVERIEQSLDLLSDQREGVTGHHHGMRAALDYSWNLLAPVEQKTFLALCVFRGGFDAEAAMAVGGTEAAGLATLIDCSFIRKSDEDRYDIHNLIHQYGQEKLRENPVLWRTLRETHSVYYAGWASSLHNELMQSSTALIQRVHRDIGNINRAWRWAVDCHNCDSVNRFYFEIFLYHEEMGLFREGMELFQAAIRTWRKRAYTETESALIEAKLQLACSSLAQLYGDFHQAELLLNAAESAIVLSELKLEKVFIKIVKGMLAFSKGEYEDSESFFLNALTPAGENSFVVGQGACFIHLGDIERMRANYDLARDYYLQSLDLAQSGRSARGVGLTLLRLGANAVAQEDLDEAKAIYLEGLATAQPGHDHWVISDILNQLGHIAVMNHDFEEGKLRFQETLKIAAERRGTMSGALDAVVGMCVVLDHEGNVKRALEYLSMALVHPSANYQIRTRAGDLANSFSARIPTERASILRLRGRVKPLNVVIAELLLL